MSMSDFNSETIEKTTSGFMELYDVKKLVRVVTTIYKNSDVLCECKFLIVDYYSPCRLDRNSLGGKIFNIY